MAGDCCAFSRFSLLFALLRISAPLRQIGWLFQRFLGAFASWRELEFTREQQFLATIREVAKRAGVAPITVSRVLNNSGYVQAATRARVEQAAAELNYVPNMLAHSLRSSRTQTLALVVADITNPFWTTVARGVEDVANGQGFNVIYCNTDENPAKQGQYVDMLLRRRVDGVLLVPADSVSEESRQAVRALQAQRVKVVVLDRRIDGVAVDSVRGDSVGGARQLTEHLLALGHRVIGCLSGPANLSVTADRVAGYSQALAAAGVAVDETLIRYGAFTVESGHALLSELLRRSPRPTAVFAANNFLAVGALRAARAAGLQVPGDLSLAVFDDLPASFVATPFLTVAAQPAYALGATAARLLLARLHGDGEPALVTAVLPTELIVRGSTARWQEAA